MHYYQFNIGDYSSHTSRLSLLEDLAYRRLLDLYYLNEFPINGTIDDISRDIGMIEHLNEITYVLNKFFTLKDDMWFQSRANQEIKNYQSKINNASKAGKASAKARQAKASERPFNDRSTDVQPNTKHKPLNIKHNIKELPQIKFEEFWNIWPKKVDKKDSVKAWKSLSDEKRREAIEGIQNFTAGKQVQYIKNPTSYLKKELWTDEGIPNETYQQSNQFTKNQKLERANQEAIEYLKQL